MAVIFQDPRQARFNGVNGVGDASEILGSVMGGEVAAVSDGSKVPHSTTHSILVGVATGALTFLVTKLLERMFR